MTFSKGFLRPDQARPASVFAAYAARACSVVTVKGFRFLATL